jgi:hypothetical protein
VLDQTRGRESPAHRRSAILVPTLAGAATCTRKHADAGAGGPCSSPVHVTGGAMSTPLFKAAEEFGARSMTAFTMGSSMTRREPSTRRQFSTTLPAVVWSRHGPRCGVLAGRRRAADDEARARRHRGIRLGCVLGTAVRDVVSVPGRRCRSERGCRCLRQDAGRGRQRGRAAGTDPCGVTEGTSACPGHRAGEPRPAQLAGCRSTARARTSATSRARSAPYTYWASVPSTAGPYRAAEQAGRVAPDIPVNHPGFVAPVLQLTLETGTQALVVAARVGLRGPRWR